MRDSDLEIEAQECSRFTVRNLATLERENSTADFAMDPPETAMKYIKTPGSATTHGLEFEWTLAALLHLRGLNSGLDFQLGTNVEGADALDDIVFRINHNGAWRTIYVQLKCKEKKQLTRTMLTKLKPKKKNEGFSLTKYFKSYLEIKKALSTDKWGPLFEGRLEDCLFVLFTNAKGMDDLGKELGEDLSQDEELLWLGSGKVFSLEEDKEMLDCLVDSGDDGRQFLKQLRVFCGQPSGEELQEAVKKELLKMDKAKTRNLNIDRVCECYIELVKVWWETKNDILHKGNDILEVAVEKITLESELFEEKIRLQTTSEQTLIECGLAIEYEATALKMFAYGLAPVALVVSSERSGLLSLTKLCQASEGQFLVLKLEDLKTNKRALLEECLNGNVKRLIVCGNKDWPLEPSDECLEIIYEILAERDNFSVVFLLNENDSDISALTARFQERYEIYTDNFLFSQLNEVSRNEILNTEVNLQGHNTSLGELLSKDNERLDPALDAALLVDILGSVGPLKVGSALPEGIGHYIERTLEQPCVSASVFQAPRETFTIRITQSESSDRGLLEQAAAFLSDLKSFPFFHKGDMRELISKLIQSPLKPEKIAGGNSHFFTGRKFSLGLYEWNCVALRFGQKNAITAFYTCPIKKGSQRASFLFVTNETTVDDVRKLSEFLQLNHMLSLEGGELRWSQSLKNIQLIRDHIDEKRVAKLSPQTATEVEDRLTLVCAEPGMGKSTLMARLAKNTKAALPHCFVILIALNDHTELFAKKKHTDMLDFLSNVAKMKSPLQRSLLKYALEVSGNVVVIADGFDEIAPRYVKECCHLLSNLLEGTKTRKIWMTSRNSAKKKLESHFSKLSSKLREFDEDDQKRFFKTFWGNTSNLSESDLDKYIDDLIKKSSKAIRDKEKNFLGIPIQCQMLADIFQDDVNASGKNIELPEMLDLFTLMEMFVDKKCRVYVEHKLGVQYHRTDYEFQCKKETKWFIDSHSKAGLVLILGKDDLKTLGMEQIIKDSLQFANDIQVGDDKTGFVDEILNDKPRFIHRVFAEYFVANWISHHLAECEELIKSKLFTADFDVIRHIFNRLLSKDLVLHTAVLHENPDEVRALLGREGFDIEAQDREGRTALHLAAGLGTSKEKVENERRGDILDLIIDKTSDFNVFDKILHGSPIRYADISRTWIAIDKLLYKTDDKAEFELTLEKVTDDSMLKIITQYDLDIFLGHCLDNDLTVKHWPSEKKSKLLITACFEGRFKVATLLIERNVSIITTKIDNKNNYEDMTPLSASSYKGHLELAKLLLEKCVSNASPSYCGEPSHVTNYIVRSKYINAFTYLGMNAIHIAAMGGKADMISFLISQGGDPLSCGYGNKTPLHMAAEFRSPSSVRVLLQALEEANLGTDSKCMSVEEYIDIKDNDGNTAMQLSALNGSAECINLMLQAGGKLSQVDSNGETLLMKAVREGHQEVVEWLLDNFNADSEGMTLQEYIEITDTNGGTVIHHAAWEGYVVLIKLIANAGGKLSQVGRIGQTPLMSAARAGKQDVLEWLLDNFNEEKEGMTVQEYLYFGGKSGTTVMHYAASGGFFECVEFLLEAGMTFSQVGLLGLTPLMLAASEGKQEGVKYLLEKFNAEREGMTVQDYIDMVDMIGNTAMDFAVKSKSWECVLTLIYAGGKFSVIRWKGKTLLMEVAMKGQRDVVKWLLDNFNVEREGMTIQEYIAIEVPNDNTARRRYVKCMNCLPKPIELPDSTRELHTLAMSPIHNVMFAEEFDMEEIIEGILEFSADGKEAMTVPDNKGTENKDGVTVMHLAACGGSVECVRLLLKAGGKMSQVDLNGETPLMRASWEGKHKVVKCLLDNFNPDSEGMTLKEYIDLKDVCGNSVLCLASFIGSVKCIKLLLRSGGNLSEIGWNGETLLMTAARGGKHKVVKYLLDIFNTGSEFWKVQSYIDLKNKDGNTALHLAASSGSVTCVKHLIQFGGKFSEVGYNDKTPLMAAAFEGKQEVVKCLLDNFNGVREGMTVQEYVDKMDMDGRSVIHLAAQAGSVSCIKRLQQAGGRVSLLDWHIRTPLMEAARQGKQKAVKWLLYSFNAEREGMTFQEYIDLNDENGYTVMHLAASSGSVKCLKLLLRAGGKLSKVGCNGKTPLMVAAGEGRQEIVEWLLEKCNTEEEGMSVLDYIDMKDQDGNCAMNYAACGGSVECLKIFCKTGGKLSHVGMNGKTPLMTAAKAGEQGVVKWLLDNFNAEKEGMHVQEYIEMKDRDGRTVIHHAAGSGCIKCLRHLCNARGKLSGRGWNGQTVLMTAASCAKQDVVKWLLNNFVEEREGMTFQEHIDTEDEDGNTVIHLAAWGGSVKCLKLLCKAGVKLYQKGWKGQTPLMLAAGKGQQEAVKWLLANFYSEDEGMSFQEYVGLKDEFGQTVIHLAARSGSVECLNLLCKAGEKLSEGGMNGETPLMTAAAAGKHEVVKWLLDNFNARKEGMYVQEYIDMKDRDGRTVMHLAAGGGCINCLRHLCNAGGKLCGMGWNGETPLMTAAWCAKQDVVKWVINNFIEEIEGMTLQECIDTEDEDGNTVMHIAAWGGSVKCLKYLCKAGGKLSQIGLNGETPLMTAARSGRTEAVKFLLNNFNEEKESMTLQEHIEIKDLDGDTVIHLAAWVGSVNIVRLLINAGGKLSQFGWNGETVLMISARKGNQEVMKYFLDIFNPEMEGFSVQEYIDLNDNNGNSVMHFAAWGGFVKCLTLLCKAGGKLSTFGLNGQTPLMTAARAGKQEVVEYLLENFITEMEGMAVQGYIEMTDDDGKTALDWAQPDCRIVVESFATIIDNYD